MNVLPHKDLESVCYVCCKHLEEGKAVNISSDEGKLVVVCNECM